MVMPFLCLFNLVLITRIMLHASDRKVGIWKILFACLVQEIFICKAFTPGQAVCQLQIAVLALNLLTWVFEKFGAKEAEAPGRRLIMVVFYAFSFSYFFSPHNNIHFSGSIKEFLAKSQDLFLIAKLAPKINWGKTNFYLFGVLLCINEANHLVRFLINKMMIRPAEPSSPEGSDEKEYNRGRIIGYLERVTFFFFITQAQYAALGFVISAKTLARFKALDERKFAEYFIIGTLLSVVIAGAVGLFIKFICPL